MAEKTDKTLNLHQRLLKIGAELNGLPKNGHHQKPNYDYITLDDINARLKPACEKYGVDYDKSESSATGDGEFWVPRGTPAAPWCYTAIVTVKWTNVDDPEDSEVSTYPISETGMTPSKARGSALTYGERYYLRDKFHLSDSEDDPDNDEGTAPVPVQSTDQKSKAKKAAPAQASAEPAGEPAGPALFNLYALGRKKGFNQAKVDKAIADKYGCKPEQITKAECDSLAAFLSAKPDVTEDSKEESHD